MRSAFSIIRVMRSTVLVSLFVYVVALPFGSVLATSLESDDGKERKKVGMSMNGGGFMAAAGVGAIMRGLQQQKIVIDGEERPAMERFDYISGISGGNIAVLLYVYSQTSTSNELLDADYVIEHPSQITPKALRRKNCKSLFYRVTKKIVPIFLSTLLGNLNRINSVWILVIYYDTLKPFGIKRNKMFGPPSMKGEKNVIVPRDGIKTVPFISFMLVGEAAQNGIYFTERFSAVIKELKNITPTGLSPLDESLVTDVLSNNDNVTFIPYVGSTEGIFTDFSLDIKTETGTFTPKKGNVKGGEQFGGSKKKHFSLEMLLGAGTGLIPFLALNAPAVTKEQADKYITIGNKFASKRKGIDFGNVKKDLLFADSGSVYQQNIATHVSHGVNHIFIPAWNTGGSGIDPTYSCIHNETAGRPLNEWLVACGGPMTFAAQSDHFGLTDSASRLNHIFDDGFVHVTAIREAFDALYLADQPLIVTIKNAKVIDNAYHGITGEGTVDITFMYVTMPRKFSHAVPAESIPPKEKGGNTVDDDGQFTNEGFHDFPYYDGGLHNSGTLNWLTNKLPKKLGGALRLINTGIMSTSQSNMYAYLGSWLINEAWGKFMMTFSNNCFRYTPFSYSLDTFRTYCFSFIASSSSHIKYFLNTLRRWC